MAIRLPDGDSARRAIPTVYRNVRMRSKLESDWARAFDHFGIPWQYEKEGHWFGNVFYYPDFWLPQSRQFVEVKGVFEPADVKKIAALLEHVEPRPFTGDDHDEDHRFNPDVSIVACLPDGEFYGFVRGTVPTLSFYAFLTRRARIVSLFHCSECGGQWFADPEASWRCQCCGTYDHAHRPVEMATSPLTGWPLSPTAGLGAWDAV